MEKMKSNKRGTLLLGSLIESQSGDTEGEGFFSFDCERAARLPLRPGGILSVELEGESGSSE